MTFFEGRKVAYLTFVEKAQVKASRVLDAPHTVLIRSEIRSLYRRKPVDVLHAPIATSAHKTFGNVKAARLHESTKHVIFFGDGFPSRRQVHDPVVDAGGERRT